MPGPLPLRVIRLVVPVIAAIALTAACTTRRDPVTDTGRRGHDRRTHNADAGADTDVTHPEDP